MKVDKIPYSSTSLYKDHKILKLFNVCRHRDARTGQSLIAFKTDKFLGVSPKRYKGICTKCMKQFTLTEDEYLHYIETGELKK